MHVSCMHNICWFHYMIRLDRLNLKKKIVERRNWKTTHPWMIKTRGLINLLFSFYFLINSFILRYANIYSLWKQPPMSYICYISRHHPTYYMRRHWLWHRLHVHNGRRQTKMQTGQWWRLRNRMLGYLWSRMRIWQEDLSQRLWAEKSCMLPEEKHYSC